MALLVVVITIALRLLASPASRMGLSGAAFQPLKRWIYDDSRRVTPSLHLRGSSSGQ